jgi:hypothetical protein
VGVMEMPVATGTPEATAFVSAWLLVAIRTSTSSRQSLVFILPNRSRHFYTKQ